jgi:hypothetical protein
VVTWTDDAPLQHNPRFRINWEIVAIAGIFLIVIAAVIGGFAGFEVPG